jgi:hypothetical protein
LGEVSSIFVGFFKSSCFCVTLYLSACMWVCDAF